MTDAFLAHEIRLLVGKLNRRLREQAHRGDLTGSQMAVISRLDREGAATVTGLARETGMRPQSMGAVVAGLEGAGLVCGSPDPKDGRQTLWSLSDACLEWLRVGRAAREDWLTRTIQSKLSEGEQARLAEALELLQRLAEP